MQTQPGVDACCCLTRKERLERTWLNGDVALASQVLQLKTENFMVKTDTCRTAVPPLDEQNRFVSLLNTLISSCPPTSIQLDLLQIQFLENH